jgi:hypothetical protein
MIQLVFSFFFSFTGIHIQMRWSTLIHWDEHWGVIANTFCISMLYDLQWLMNPIISTTVVSFSCVMKCTDYQGLQRHRIDEEVQNINGEQLSRIKCSVIWYSHPSNHWLSWVTHSPLKALTTPGLWTSQEQQLRCFLRLGSCSFLNALLRPSLTYIACAAQYLQKPSHQPLW